ncbi:MAG: alpha/beta hydrolase [Actinomycetota bacterium]|nr:alpha/beta hydrolase [Actinomycetota bacterium]
MTISLALACIFSTTFSTVAEAVGATKTKVYYYSTVHDVQHEIIGTYHPGRRNQPWVVTIHGGSWKHGDTSSVTNAALLFSRNGYVVFNLGYPLLNSPSVTWHDIRQALNDELGWIRAHAGAFGINPRRGAAYGFSAGGHLALELGLAGDGDHGIRAVVSVSGVVQPRRVADDALGKRPTTEPATSYNQYLYGVEKEAVGCDDTYDDPTCNAAWADFSPQTEISPHDPAVLMFAGTEDPVVPYQSNGAMAYLLRRQGVSASYVYVSGLGHTSRTALDDGRRQARMLKFVATATK